VGATAPPRGREPDGPDFRGKDLKERRFQGTDLTGSDFRDADLRGAAFVDVKGLSADALGGADLTGVTLPDDVAKFDGLESIGEVSRYIQILYQIILAISSFAVLTVLSVRDENMILHHAMPTTVLPFIQASISARMFGWAMPVIIFLLFVYQLIYYKELWRQLADLPAVFPDGTPLDKKAYTLTTNCLIRLYSRRLRPQDTGPLRRERALAILIVHGPVVCTMALFWFYYLKEHSWPTGLVRVALLTLTVCLSYYAHGIMARHLLSREPAAPGHRAGGWHATARGIRRMSTLAVVISLFTLTVTGIAIYLPRTLLPEPWSRRLYANISNRRISAGEQDADKPAAADAAPAPMRRGDGLDAVVGADLSRANLRGMDATRAFLAKSDLREADLRDAVLVSADLRHSRLNGALLQGVDLRGADLRESVLRGAHLSLTTRFLGGRDPDLPIRNGTDLKDAHLEGIYLEGYDPGDDERDPTPADQKQREQLGERWLNHFQQARNYQFAHYDARIILALKMPKEAAVETRDAIPQHSLDLKSKTLRGYHFDDNQMQLTSFETYDFAGSTFQRTMLWGSSLKDCNLRDTDFTGAFLSEVDFRGAHLERANLAEAHLRGANFSGVDLSRVKGLVKAQMEVAIWDCKTTFPAKANYPGVKQKEFDELDALRRETCPQAAGSAPDKDG
jgi:uncharacterized protein YjbI with pentapeptide repeats